MLEDKELEPDSLGGSFQSSRIEQLGMPEMIGLLPTARFDLRAPSGLGQRYWFRFEAPIH